MQCHECAKRGMSQVAVAICRSCSAGLCLEHVRETARRMDTGSLAPTCHHDTWIVERVREAARAKQRLAAQ
jgi:hypothetical protein